MRKPFEEIQLIIERVLVRHTNKFHLVKISFSTARRINAYLRTYLTTMRLRNFVLTSIQIEFGSELLQNPTKIIDKYLYIFKLLIPNQELY